MGPRGPETRDPMKDSGFHSMMIIPIFHVIIQGVPTIINFTDYMKHANSSPKAEAILYSKHDLSSQSRSALDA